MKQEELLKQLKELTIESEILAKFINSEMKMHAEDPRLIKLMNDISEAKNKINEK